MVQFLEGRKRGRRLLPGNKREQQLNAAGYAARTDEARLRLYGAFKGELHGSTPHESELGIEDAVKLVNRSKARFVWLGVESAEYVGRILNVGRDKVIKMDPDELYGADRALLYGLYGHVLVCYNGNLSGYLSDFLKAEYDIETYNLKGGILRASLVVVY